MLKTFGQEKEDWIEKFREKFAHLPGLGNTSSNSGNDPMRNLAFGPDDRSEWETEKVQLLKNWSEETDVLTMVCCPLHIFVCLSLPLS